MSKEWTHNKLTCTACGAEGKLSMWSDDWNRWDAELDGFSGIVRITGPQRDELKCKKCGSFKVKST